MSDHRDGAEAAGTSPSGGPTVIDVTPTPGPEPERPAVPPKPRRNSVAISALMTLVLALATSPYWTPPVASVLPWGSALEPKPVPVDLAPINAKLSALEARVAELVQVPLRIGTLEQRVAQLEQRPAPATNPAAEQAAQQARALGDRLASLEQRIAALASAASVQTASDATKGLQADVQALTQKLEEQSRLLATVQSREVGSGERANAALIVTVGQLRSALATSRSYAAELQSAEALAKDQPDTLRQLQTLDPRAERGIPTLEGLRERFAAVADAVDRLVAPPPEAGWRERLMGWTRRFFHVRRVGAGDVGGPAEALAAAEAALGAGDLAGAVTAVHRLKGPAADPAKSWLDDAEARLDADQTLAAVTGALTRGPTGTKP